MKAIDIRKGSSSGVLLNTQDISLGAQDNTNRWSDIRSESGTNIVWLNGSFYSVEKQLNFRIFEDCIVNPDGTIRSYAAPIGSSSQMLFFYN